MKEWQSLAHVSNGVRFQPIDDIDFSMDFLLMAPAHDAMNKKSKHINKLEPDTVAT